MDEKQLTEKLVLWIKDKVTAANCQGTVLGISGGVDSAVVAVLCQRAFPQTTLAINLPCYSNPEDQEHAKLVADKFSINYRVIELNDIYDNFIKLLPQDKNSAARDHMTKSNLKVRLRMVTLYYFANRLKYLVVGSGNRSELSVGYFTKYGDGGVDILPIGNLLKRQVVQLAKYLGIPEEIIEKPPSAGLWQGQTDEGEMGLTYRELDTFLTNGNADATIKAKIESMMANCQHKLILPPVPDF